MNLRRSSIATTLYAWNDVLWSLVMCFLVLMAVQEKSDDTPLQTKAGAIAVYVEWEHGKDLDVDTWIQYPSCSKPIFYSRLQCTNGWLARDDKGRADSLANSENASLYDLVAGEYGVNLHAFRQGQGDEFNGRTWVTVIITHRSDNGVSTTIFNGTVWLTKVDEEITVIRWTMDEAGQITNKTQLYKKLVEKATVEGRGTAR